MSVAAAVDQEMHHYYIITLLPVHLSLLWSAVTCLECYRCNSIETPSCTHAGGGGTHDWQTCHDDIMCLTGIGVAPDLDGSLLLYHVHRIY